MTRILLTKAALALLAAGSGLLVGTLAATTPLAVLNHLATDGPLLPPQLVAFGMLAAPIGILLMPAQVVLVGYELLYLRDAGGRLLLMAPLAGLLAGFGWFQVLRSDQASAPLLAGLLALGIMQAAAVFGLHWLVDRALALMRLWRWAEGMGIGDK
ncbi:MAG TPA: hypothetical protein VGA52_06135 [Anaerolineales bacterium]|jgi:hypothetical protein